MLARPPDPGPQTRAGPRLPPAGIKLLARSPGERTGARISIRERRLRGRAGGDRSSDGQQLDSGGRRRQQVADSGAGGVGGGGGDAEGNGNSAKEAAGQVEGVDRDYCDDFVCTSSPSVEQTVKAFAADLEKQRRWTLGRFADDVRYQDPFRSFTGVMKYQRPGWAQENVESPSVVVKKLKMLDKGTAAVEWTLTGQLGVIPLVVNFESIITMNQLTGRILEHRDSWDLSRCSPPAALAFIVNRMFWSVKQTGGDAKDSVDAVSKSLSSMDEEEFEYYPGDPTDPTKWFFQQDSMMKDAFTYAAGIALLYAMYQAWNFIFRTKF